MQSDEFIKLVSVRAETHSRDETEHVIKAVFETLRDRIVHDTGDNVKAQLPHDLQRLWESGFVDHVAHKMSGPVRMDLSGFIGRVADRLNTDDFSRAEKATAAVFMTLRQAVTPGAQESIEKEFPEDIKEFWLRQQPPEMPEESPASQKAAAQQGPPYEMEAPVKGATEEEAGTGPWRGESAYESGRTGGEQPATGAQMHTEEGWHHREVGQSGQPLEAEQEIVLEPGSMARGQQEGAQAAEQQQAHPPAEERVELVPPPGAHDASAGPGSDTHYRSDPQLEQEIRQLLEDSGEVDAGKIDIFVQAGNATLRGHAKDHHQRDMAGRIAAKALGVGSIFNEVIVEENQTHEMGEGEGI